MRRIIIGLMLSVLGGTATNAATTFHIEGSGFETCEKNGKSCKMNKRRSTVAPFDGYFTISDEAGDLAGRDMEFFSVYGLPLDWLTFGIKGVDDYRYQQDESATLLHLQFDALGEIASWYLGMTWYGYPGCCTSIDGGSMVGLTYTDKRHRTYRGSAGTMTIVEGGVPPTVNPAPVPLPPSIALLLAGLVGLWGVRRKG